MESFKIFNEEKLADKKCFYNSVKDGATGDNGEKLDGHINNEDYLTCKKIWNEFNMKNMSDYHDHYLEKVVLLLDNVFEKFIDTCLKFYKLVTCHYFSFPRLTWDAMRYGEANNKYMKDYDPTKPSKLISYLDMNNLYGWAMSGFKWLKKLIILM